jgi:hypothetical protein
MDIRLCEPFFLAHGEENKVRVANIDQRKKEEEL